ncbi:MAG: hypothetical protein LBN29_05710 [Mediterranea sp.]|nr:hypothetical protein [Mediterranea sp.]
MDYLSPVIQRREGADGRIYKQKVVKSTLMTEGSTWLCEDIIILPDSVADLPNNVRLSMGVSPDYSVFCVLGDNKGNKYTVSLETKGVMEYLVEEKYYLAELAQQEQTKAEQKAEQERIEKEREERIKKEKQERIEKYIRLYGQRDGTLIANGKISLGMSTTMCREAWGYPYDTYKKTTEVGTTEVWSYRGGNRLHFANDILRVIEEL